MGSGYIKVIFWLQVIGSVDGERLILPTDLRAPLTEESFVCPEGGQHRDTRIAVGFAL